MATIVAAWIRAEPGVGPSRAASGSQMNKRELGGLAHRAEQDAEAGDGSWRAACM